MISLDLFEFTVGFLLHQKKASPKKCPDWKTRPWKIQQQRVTTAGLRKPSIGVLEAKSLAASHPDTSGCYGSGCNCTRFGSFNTSAARMAVGSLLKATIFLGN